LNYYHDNRTVRFSTVVAQPIQSGMLLSAFVKLNLSLRWMPVLFFRILPSQYSLHLLQSRHMVRPSNLHMYLHPEVHSLTCESHEDLVCILHIYCVVLTFKYLLANRILKNGNMDSSCLRRHYVSHPYEISYNNITLCTSNVSVSNRVWKE